MSDAAPPPNITIEAARVLALAWLHDNDPAPELLRWVRSAMLERWCGAPIGSGLTTGMEMAWAIGADLGILDHVSPAGMQGVLPLCTAAGWPRHPGPDDDPLPPLT